MFCKHGLQVNDLNPCPQCRMENFMQIGFYAVLSWVVLGLLYLRFCSR